MIANYFKKWQKNRGMMDSKMITRNGKRGNMKNNSCMAKLGHFKPETRKKS